MEVDKDHIHLLLRALAGEHRIAAAVFLEVSSDLGGAFVRGDELQVGGAQGDLALQGGAQEETRGVADAVEHQQEQIVTESPDEGGDDQTPDGTLDKAQARGLEALGYIEDLLDSASVLKEFVALLHAFKRKDRLKKIIYVLGM